MTTLRRLIKYRRALGALLALVEEATQSTKDGKLTYTERAKLFTRFWDIMDAAQMRRRK